TLALDEQRRILSERLPLYMVPAAFVVCDSLPLTANGKLDRQALPIPTWDEENSGNAYEPPRTPVEEMLAQIWSQVFEIERIGIHDSFYALGGDSLLSVQIVSRAVQAGLPITIGHILKYQTIADLSAFIEESLAE